MGLDLREQVLGLPLDGLDRVSASDEPQRRGMLIGDRHQSLASFAGSPPCLPLIASQAGRVWAVRSA